MFALPPVSFKAQQQHARTCSSCHMPPHHTRPPSSLRVPLTPTRHSLPRLLPPLRTQSCVPGLLSKEALLVLVQGGLLVSRTLLTDYISRIEGHCGRAITSLVSTGAVG